MNTPIQIAPASFGTTATQGTSVSGGSGAGTYTTTKVQLIASLDYDAAGLIVSTSEGTTVGSLWKLYVGGSGSEVEICEFVGSNANVQPQNLFVPIAIPAGSRISAAKADSDGFGAAARIHVMPVRGRTFDPLVSRGTLIGVTSGALTDVDAGATVDTKGVWAQITSSTARDAKGFSLLGYGDGSATANVRFFIDIGVGGSGSEVTVLENLCVAQESFRVALNGTPFGPVWVPIPAGSRVTARAQCSSATATDRVPRLCLVLWE